MRAAGARCEVQLWPGQVHGFPALGAKSVPEARAAVAYGSEFLRLPGGRSDNVAAAE